MKSKKRIIPLIAIAFAFFGVVVILVMIQNINHCSTLEKRELRLREISNLGEVTSIEQELLIDGYILSGYTTKNNRYGIAVFAPKGNGNYEFQSNANKKEKEIVILSTRINQTLFNIFWANKENLDYAEITYTIDGNVGETLRIGAKENQIIYTEAPAKDYSVEYFFVDKNEKRYG